MHLLMGTYHAHYISAIDDQNTDCSYGDESSRERTHEFSMHSFLHVRAILTLANSLSHTSKSTLLSTLRYLILNRCLGQRVHQTGFGLTIVVLGRELTWHISDWLR